MGQLRQAAQEGAESKVAPVGFVDRLAIELAMAGGIGRIKKAPGTFGSLPGLAVAYGFHAAADRLSGGAHDTAVYWLALLAQLSLLTALGWWAIARTERVLGIHDDQRIVIDEVAGQAIAACALPLAWPWYGAAFVLFRLFDITKPGLIGRIDRDGPGAFGTLFDDVLAGVVAGVLLLAALYFLPGAMLA